MSMRIISSILRSAAPRDGAESGDGMRYILGRGRSLDLPEFDVGIVAGGNDGVLAHPTNGVDGSGAVSSDDLQITRNNDKMNM